MVITDGKGADIKAARRFHFEPDSVPTDLRRVRYVNPDTGRAYVFFTNIFHLSAKEIAYIYKARWDIELFFKWIKQNLKIKSFFGTSENAVRIQIWCAL
ncbi:transposase [Thermodesulfobacteriota bacterium]